MSFFNAIYNLLARSKIGELFGMEWDPEKDLHFLRESEDFNASLLASSVTARDLLAARSAIDTGDYERAHRIVNRAILKLFVYEHPLIEQARNEAQKIHTMTSAHVEQTDLSSSSSDYLNAANALAYSNELNTHIERGAFELYKKASILDYVSGADNLDLPIAMFSPWGDNVPLTKIIKFCQQALRKDARNGDAHVLLAKTYFALAFNGERDALYRHCINCAEAAIIVWKSKKMDSKARPVGEQLYAMVITRLQNKHPGIPISGLSNIIRAEYYPSAVNLDEYDDLEKLLNARWKR